MLTDRGGELRLWQFKSPVPKVENKSLKAHGFWSLAAGAGPTIAYSEGDRSLSVWNLTRQEPIRFKPPGTCLRVALSPDGQVVAAAVDRTVRLWETSRGRELAVLQGHTGMVLALAFSPDGRLLASGGLDESIRFWNVGSGPPALRQSFAWPTGVVSALAFSSDGLLCAAAGENGSIVIWDVDV